MANIIAWISVGVGFLALAFIVIRKFPILASIDLSQIEAEKQAEVKKRILDEKFKRDVSRVLGGAGKWLKPVVFGIARFFKSIYNKLVNLRETYSQQTPDDKVSQDISQRIEVLFAEAEELDQKEELDKAEKKYIEIIGLDSRNFKAFELLGENYLERQKLNEAEQTFEHVIKLKEQLVKKGLIKSNREAGLANDYFNLGLAYEKMNEKDKSLANIKRALEIEPNHPRYLDKMAELCIILKQADQAMAACKQLALTNAGNKKLQEFRQKIKAIEEEAEAEEDQKEAKTDE